MKNKVKAKATYLLGGLQYLAGEMSSRRITRIKGISKIIESKILSKLP